jgi:hypothetical protein
MPKKNKNRKQTEPASEEPAQDEVAQTKPDVPPSPSPKENQIEPATPQRPKAMPEEEPETEEARDVPAQTPPRQLVAVAEIPKAPAGACAVCRGKSNVGEYPLPVETLRALSRSTRSERRSL